MTRPHPASHVGAAEIRAGWALGAIPRFLLGNVKPACTPITAELFFTHDGQGLRQPHEAFDICAGCPLVEPCYQWAVDHGERHGIWGGVNFSLRSRQALAAEQRHTRPENTLRAARRAELAADLGRFPALLPGASL